MQGNLFEMKNKTQTGPVTCLGLNFDNDETRRKYFTEELRKKLPDLKNIAGYPMGEDEAILALSDPPYYTACPNPWINDFIVEWNKEKQEKYGKDKQDYHREPFAADVSEGKNDPIYLAHSYHTKVPFKAVMRYILHYTEPGDIVFDGFSGSGMTGVAGNLCGDASKVNELLDSNGENHYKVGKRNVLLNDLSPVASHISSSFNHITWDVEAIEELELVINEVEKKLGWMYQTNHNNSQVHKGKINYVVFSEVFVCSNCNQEVVFWNEAVDIENGIVKDAFICKHCGSEISKRVLEKLQVKKYDSRSNEVYSQNKMIPVLISYTYQNKRFEKEPDADDIRLLDKIDEYDVGFNYPNNDLIYGDEIGRLKGSFHTKVSHLLSKRNNIVLYEFLKSVDKCDGKIKKIGRFLLTAALSNLSWMYRWRANNKGGTTSGTYYICSTPQENNPFIQLERKLKDFKKITSNGTYNNVVSVQSSTKVCIKDASIDYIFIDPPFGANLMYSELNFLWESWLKVFTNNEDEAIINNNQRKLIDDYKSLMHECFKENYRILKPGRWITVEFSNSKASVWNAIREAIEKAGFVIANVSSLDKKQGSFKAVTTTTAVKQDLVISAYKPHSAIIEQMKNEQNTEESAWTFIKQHLEQLPVFIGKKGNAEIIVERTPRILFDRMVAYHVQNGYLIPISSGDFQSGIEHRFPMRDGMAFLETQVAEYDKKRIAKEFTQMSLFVADENSAIEWLRQQLMKKPQTRQELHPNFMKEIQHIAKHEVLPELDALLEQNFLIYDGIEDVPSQIHTYLSSDYKELRNLAKNDNRLKIKAKDRWYVPDPNKQSDLEKLREKSLLREFEAYREEIINNRKKLKQFRTEAIRVGFKKAWGEKDYHTIVSIGERLPESVLQEDDKLLMYFDNSQIRLGL